jgi:succinate dehydrogenase/fumarate reductase flavoprotein subunit
MDEDGRCRGVMAIDQATGEIHRFRAQQTILEHGVAGAVGRGTGALGGALAVIGGHAAERALVDT